MTKLDPQDFKTFSDLAKGLPRLKPRTAQQWLSSVYYDILLSEADTVTLGTLSVGKSELSELFHEVELGAYPSKRVSPAGARLLLKLYQGNALETKGKGPQGEPSAEFLSYCESEPRLLQAAETRAAKQQAYLERLEHPESFKEEEFTYSLLNDLFWKHLGAGAGELNVGGRLIRKAVQRIASNSGKSHDFSVDYLWEDAQGAARRLNKESVFAGNRRNDEARNWGLPE